MNAPRTPPEFNALAMSAGHAEGSGPSRIREIPYNYTSFSDREIVMRLLGDEAWDWLERLRQERRTGRSARMLYEVLGDIWVVQRNPYLQDDLLDNPGRRKLVGRGLAPPLGRGAKTPHAQQRCRNAMCGWAVCSRPLAAVDGFAQNFERMAALRRKAQKVLRKCTAKRQHQVRRPVRVSHVTDATDWRVEYPFVVLTPTPRPRWPPWSRRASSWA
jgi:hypothetical protein